MGTPPSQRLERLERLTQAARGSPSERAVRASAIIEAVPTYDYQCRGCGTVTEVIHSMLEDGPSTCEKCGGDLRRVLYPTGIIFKGSGFYRNDSRAPAPGSAGSRPGTSDAGSSIPESGSTSDGKAAPATKDAGTSSAAGSTTKDSTSEGS